MKKEVKEWCITHKRELIIAGVTVTAIIAGVVVIKNWDKIAPYLRKSTIPEKTHQISIPSTQPSAISSIPSPVMDLPSERIINIDAHIMNLPNWKHPSPEKLATAAEHGFNLVDNETWVIEHTRKYAA